MNANEVKEVLVVTQQERLRRFAWDFAQWSRDPPLQLDAGAQLQVAEMLNNAANAIDRSEPYASGAAPLSDLVEAEFARLNQRIAELEGLVTAEWYFVDGVRYCSVCRTRRCRRQVGGTLDCSREGPARMTRRSDMMLEDLLGCDHVSETPIVDHGGEILYWVCRCGRIHPVGVATLALAQEKKPRE